MIKFLSSWVKTFGLTIVIVSILEMLLPNNKTKKYIRMVMGIYIIFTMISPFISNKEIFSVDDNMDFDDYVSKQTSSNLNQTSMDKRLEELYQEELEKDITKKLEEKGYEVKNCKVKISISDKEKDTQITKIKLNVNKLETIDAENSEEREELIENKIVTEIQKIKPINTTLGEKEEETQNKKNLNKVDIQNIKKFLIEEYEVEEKCLEIN